MKTEQLPNNFQDLLIFEDSQTNLFCDLLTQEVFNITGKRPHLVGSVSKILSGTYDKDYQPKDIDFALDNISFRRVLASHNKSPIFSFGRMVECRPERFIIYLENMVIELWNFFHKNYGEELKYYENKIPYLCQ